MQQQIFCFFLLLVVAFQIESWLKTSFEYKKSQFIVHFKTEKKQSKLKVTKGNQPQKRKKREHFMGLCLSREFDWLRELTSFVAPFISFTRLRSVIKFSNGRIIAYVNVYNLPHQPPWAGVIGAVGKLSTFKAQGSQGRLLAPAQQRFEHLCVPAGS